MWLRLPSLALPGEEDELRELAMQDLKALGGKNFRAPDFEEAGDRTNTVRVTVGQWCGRPSAMDGLANTG